MSYDNESKIVTVFTKVFFVRSIILFTFNFRNIQILTKLLSCTMQNWHVKNKYSYRGVKYPSVHCHAYLARCFLFFALRILNNQGILRREGRSLIVQAKKELLNIFFCIEKHGARNQHGCRNEMDVKPLFRSFTNMEAISWQSEAIPLHSRWFFFSSLCN